MLERFGVMLSEIDDLKITNLGNQKFGELYKNIQK